VARKGVMMIRTENYKLQITNYKLQIRMFKITNEKLIKAFTGGPDATRGGFFKKGVGDPNPFTVSQMPLFRGRHLKSLPKKQSFTRY
jgi:hypothetical protein